MARLPMEKKDMGEKNSIGWDTYIDTGHILMKKAVSRYINR